MGAAAVVGAYRGVASELFKASVCRGSAAPEEESTIYTYTTHTTHNPTPHTTHTQHDEN
jgi:hypothetical protein